MRRLINVGRIKNKELEEGVNGRRKACAFWRLVAE